MPPAMPTLLRPLLALVLCAAALAGTFVAPPAHAQSTGDDIEAEGPITALGDSSLTVGGLTFVVTPQTDIHDDDDNPLAFADLTLGLFVEVEGFDDGGTLVATEIEVEEDHGGDGDEIEAEGLVVARTDSSLTVGGLTFGVTASTVIVDDDDEPVPFSAITVGLRVEVEGRLLASGALVATEIEIDDDDDDGGDIEVEGLIESLDEGTMTVRGIAFALTDATVVVGDDDEPLTLADLAVGLRVEVDGRYETDGSLTALRVELEDFGDDEIEITGAIEALSDTSLTVAATDFAVTPQTVVLDRNRLPIPFASLALGQTVEVKGTVAADGRYVATRIKLEDGAAGDGEIEVRAALDAVTDSVAVVVGRPFVVTPATLVRGDDDQPVALASLPLGLPVEVRARRAADGSLVALVIEQEDGPATAVRLRADVTAVSADSLSVLGVAFDAAGATVTGLDGQPTTLASVSVGQSVRVTGAATATGFTASAVEILRGAQAAGRVASTSAGAFALPGVTVATTAATLFLDEDGAFVAPSAVTSGATVRVFGTATSAGLDASRVVVLDAATVVAGEAAPEAAFALDAPFPNPATASATLRYTLGASAAVAVAVYDALGRVVLRVDAGAALAGRHETRIDTSRLPAGLYLVRLTTDGQPAATQTLTVVR